MSSETCSELRAWGPVVEFSHLAPYLIGIDTEQSKVFTEDE